MDDKKDLTERLKAVELELMDLKQDLKSVAWKLKTSYDYQDELEIRRVAAAKKTKDLQDEHAKILTLMNGKLTQMKNILDIYTGNFYTLA